MSAGLAEGLTKVAAFKRGRWRYNVSPKSNSLAYEEMLGDVTSNEVEFVPELNLLVSKKMLSTKVESKLQRLPISIRGSITVSF